MTRDAIAPDLSLFSFVNRLNEETDTESSLKPGERNGHDPVTTGFFSATNAHHSHDVFRSLHQTVPTA